MEEKKQTDAANTASEAPAADAGSAAMAGGDREAGNAGDAPGGSGEPGLGERKTVATALGEIAWLLSQSPNHRHSLFCGDLEWFCMPALLHNQYRLFYAEGRPIGVAFWAFVTETVEARLAAGGRIGADDWRAGDRVWLTELVAPFGNQEAMLEDLRNTALANRRFRFIRTHANGRRETVELNGIETG
jgi:cytolysin-activating lysine-acyltransferase